MSLEVCAGIQALQYIHNWYEKQTRSGIIKFADMQIVQDS